MLSESLRQRAAIVLAIIVAISLMAVAGLQAGTRPVVSLAIAAAVLYVGIVALDVALVPVISLVVLLVTARVGAAGVDLTMSDFAMGLALPAAILFATRGVSAPMRSALWLAVVYQVATLFTVLNNPYSQNLVEWFHAGLLVGGALLIGWAIGDSGRARIGMHILIAMAVVLALIHFVEAARQYAGGDFGPLYMSWPYQSHKNATGTIFALMAMFVYVRPVWMRWRRGPALVVFWLLVAALLTTQSRQAILGLVVGIIVFIAQQPRVKAHAGWRRRSKAILLALIPVVVVITVMIRDQIRSGNQFNSFFQRIDWFSEAITVWSSNPWVGAGLRWWYTDRFSTAFQPPNAELDTLTSAGLVGLAAFLALLIGTWVIARRLPPAYGAAAASVLLVRFVQSQFDLFWVSVQVSVPFVILGIVLGAANRANPPPVRRA